MHTTPVSLLERLRQPDEDRAWDRFVELYTPLLLYWAQRTGMQSQDAADLVQEVFITLVNKLPEFNYDQARSFRGWLRTVIMNKWRDRQRKNQGRNAGNDIGLSGVVSPNDLEASWDQEQNDQLVRRALEVMKDEFEPATWKSCWGMIVDGKSAAELAGELHISENAVYIAKCRVLRKLRQELQGFLD